MEQAQKIQCAIRKQAEFIHELTYEQLSPKAIMAAKLILLDSIGCMAAGTRQYDTSNLEEGSYTIVGRCKTSKTNAVFINGAAMVKNEMDEGNQFAAGHPACHIIPAALAVMEHKKITGKELITAIVAAYETSCRWGRHAKVKAAMHVHGTMQTMGAAVISCKLSNCDVNQIENAIITANSLPQAASWTAAFEGDQLRNAYVGISNVIGMNAFEMNQIGIGSSINTLESVWMDILDGDIDATGLSENLGTKYYIEKNYFKKHSACRYIHSFADMVHEFIKQGLKAEDVEKIEIETYSAASKLSGKSAKNSFAMRFSIPVSIAVSMIYGNLNIENVTDEHVQDARVKELAQKISVIENKEFTAKLPEIRENKITIYTFLGKKYEKDTEVTKGDYLDPFSNEEVIQKFNNITSGVWQELRRKEICNYILNLDTQMDVRECLKIIGRE